MARPSEQLIGAIEEWARVNATDEHQLTSWARLCLGLPWATLTAAEREGHPTLAQLRDRMLALVEGGVWEPWLVSSLARALGDHLDELADAELAERRLERGRRDLESFASDPGARMLWVEDVRDSQMQDGLAEDELATDATVDTYVAAARSNLQPLSAAELAGRARRARSWREIAAGLLDLTREPGMPRPD